MFSLEIVGNYSINDERKYSNDITQLKYYKKLLNCRNVKFDLDLSNNIIYVLEEDMKLNFML